MNPVEWRALFPSQLKTGCGPTVDEAQRLGTQIDVVHQTESVHGRDEAQRAAEILLDILRLIGSHLNPSVALGQQDRLAGSELPGGSDEDVGKTHVIGQIGRVNQVELILRVVLETKFQGVARMEGELDDIGTLPEGVEQLFQLFLAVAQEDSVLGSIVRLVEVLWDEREVSVERGNDRRDAPFPDAGLNKRRIDACC